MNVTFPAYQVILNKLLEELSLGKFAIGAPFYTEEVLINRFKVAKMTVRAATRQLVDQGYIRSQRGFGSCVAKLPEVPQKLKVTKHCVIGVMAGTRMLIADRPFARIVAGLHDEALKKGFLIYLGAENVAPIIKAQVDGLVILDKLNAKSIKQLQDANIPTVSVNREYTGLFPSIMSNMDKAGQSVWSYLYEKGYKRLALGGSGKGAELVQKLLLPGIKQAMTKTKSDGYLLTDLVSDDYSEKLETLLSKNRVPDLLVLMNGNEIFSTLQLIEKYSLRIPEDIAIIVHGERAVELNTPVHLSIISHNYQQAAKIAIDSLLGLMREEKVGDSYFGCSIVERGSS